MVTEASILAVLKDEALQDDGTVTLPIELSDIPGAVWQAELQSLMPPDVRVSLFERGGRKCALLRFPADGMDRAPSVFAEALQGANEVSREAHEAAKAVREARARQA